MKRSVALLTQLAPMLTPYITKARYHNQDVNIDKVSTAITGSPFVYVY